MLKEKYLPYQITQHNKHRRINRLNIKIKDADDKSMEFEDEYIISR
jgi:hypothetical protein